MKLFDDLHIYPWTSFTANNCNTYLVGREGKILIDPGHAQFFGNVEQQMKSDGFDPANVELILVTHSHPDHFEAVDLFFDKPVKIGLSEPEEVFLEKVGPDFARMMGLAMPKYRIDLHLAEGDLSFAGIDFQVFMTPGHSPGHLCFYWPERKTLFSGDLIFDQGVGRTDFPGGDGALLKQSILRMAELDMELILSGHGDMVQGKDKITANFDFIQQAYFPYV